MGKMEILMGGKSGGHVWCKHQRPREQVVPHAQPVVLQRAVVQAIIYGKSVRPRAHILAKAIRQTEGKCQTVIDAEVDALGQSSEPDFASRQGMAIAG